jgi:hypothetical protein
MRLWGLLPWFCEDPSDLRRAILSYSPLIDGIVAIDGDMAITKAVREEYFAGYWKFIDKHPFLQLHVGDGADGVNSPFVQIDAIKDACEEAGLECVIIRPDKIWVGETEKLNYCFSVMHEYCDWFTYIHADFELDNDITDVVRVRKELQNLKEQNLVWAKEIAVDNPKEKRTSRQDIKAGNEGLSPLLIKASPYISVEKRHWYWFYSPPVGQRLCLTKRLIGAEKPKGYRYEREYRLKAPFRLKHWVLWQDKLRMRFKHEYLRVKNSQFYETGID